MNIWKYIHGYFNIFLNNKCRVYFIEKKSFLEMEYLNFCIKSLDPSINYVMCRYIRLKNSFILLCRTILILWFWDFLFIYFYNLPLRCVVSLKYMHKLYIRSSYLGISLKTIKRFKLYRKMVIFVSKQVKCAKSFIGAMECIHLCKIH